MIYTFSPFGFEGAVVGIEVDQRRGIPAIDIVGLADSEVKECRERALSAIRNSDIPFTYERILVALNPCDMKKVGDVALPLALAILCSDVKDNWLVYGDMDLSGNLHPLRGLYAAVTTSVSNGIKKCIVPRGYAGEAMTCGMEVYEASTLKEAYDIVVNGGEKTIMNISEEQYEVVNGIEFCKNDSGVDILEFKHGKAFNAVALAIASGENLMFVGAPGCGKTLVMTNSKCLMPLLTTEEAIPVTRIHSLAGLTTPADSLKKEPPFRMPHHTASIEGICGGGIHCHPGEISLAHNGVLLLDEAAEFRSSVLQMLRVPLENKSITLSRAGRQTVYPAKFQLFLATNPCPCGNYGHESKLCLCSARSVELYWRKFGGPLLDRVAIRFKVEDDDTSASIEDLRFMIANARKKSLARGFKWADASPLQLTDYLSEKNIKPNVNEEEFSPRAVAQIIHLALTLADMHGREVPNDDDWKVAESFRKPVTLGF